MVTIFDCLLAYWAVPLTGWHLYARLRRRMSDAGVADPPAVPTSLACTAYGGWLMTLLVILSRAWTEWMILVPIYADVVAPPLMFYSAVTLYRWRRASVYHRRALVASGGYVGLYVVSLLLLAALVAFEGSD